VVLDTLGGNDDDVEGGTRVWLRVRYRYKEVNPVVVQFENKSSREVEKETKN